MCVSSVVFGVNTEYEKLLSLFNKDQPDALFFPNLYQ